MSFTDYKPAEQDYRIWLVINPATWLIPIFIALAVLVVSIHSFAVTLPGQGWHARKAPVAAVAAPVAAPVAK